MHTVRSVTISTLLRMMTVSRLAVLSHLILLTAFIAPMYLIAEEGMTTIAGTGERGLSGDNGPARKAQISSPGAMMVDDQGNVLFVEGERQRFSEGFGEDFGESKDRQRVRRIDGQTRIITTVEKPERDSVPSNRRVRRANQLWFIEGNRIRRVDTATNVITTVAGTDRSGFSGDAGPADKARLNEPSALTVDGSGNIFVADTGNYRIRRIDALSGMMTTVAGNGKKGDSAHAGPAIPQPYGVAVDKAGNVFFIDQQCIRRIDAVTHLVTLVISNNGWSIGGIAVDSEGNLYFSDASNSRIRRLGALTPQVIQGFNPFPRHIFKDVPFTISGIIGGASGQPIVLASANPAVATIQGMTVTIVGVGSVTITANQAGRGDYAVATTVEQVLTVDP